MTRREFIFFSAVAMASLVGIGGLITELLSSAATQAVAKEAEDGTLAGNAAAVAENGASGGKAIKFDRASGGSGGSAFYPGISVGYPNSPNTPPAAQFAAMKTAGATWVRPGAYYYGTANSPIPSNDGLASNITTAINAGLQVALNLSGTPAQMLASGFAAWAGRNAAYYGPLGVKYYEIGNEVNINSNWIGGANAAQYCALLKSCYSAIKAAYPEAVILHAGLAVQIGSDGVDQYPYFQAMYQAMGGNSDGYFDIANMHTYTYGNSGSVPTASAGNNFYTAFGPTGITCRALMVAHGDADKPMWSTEMGTPTSTTGGYPSYSYTIAAKTFAAMYDVLLKNDWNWVQRIAAYKWQDDATDAFGLTTSSYGPKTVAASSYIGQPSDVTSVLDAFSAGANKKYPTAFAGPSYP